MKITFGNQTLSDSADNIHMSELRVNDRQVVQEEDLLRSVEAASFARGNIRTTVSFKVARLHASISEAEAFVLAHAADLPTTADLAFLANAEGSELALRLAAACRTGAEGNYMGRTSYFSYSFTGGKIKRGTA